MAESPGRPQRRDRVGYTAFYADNESGDEGDGEAEWTPSDGEDNRTAISEDEDEDVEISEHDHNNSDAEDQTPVHTGGRKRTKKPQRTRRAPSKAKSRPAMSISQADYATLRNEAIFKGKGRAPRDDTVEAMGCAAEPTAFNEPGPSNQAHPNFFGVARSDSSDNSGVRLDHISEHLPADCVEDELSSLRRVCHENSKKIDSLTMTVESLVEVVRSQVTKKSSSSSGRPSSSTMRSSTPVRDEEDSSPTKAGLLPVSTGFKIFKATVY